MKQQSTLTSVCQGLVALILTVGLIGGFAEPATAQSPPALILDASMPTQPSVPVAAPMGFANGGHTITAIAFSLDLDPSGLAFDPTDSDMDGLPDSVSLPEGEPPVFVFDYDPADTDGEIDVLMADLSGTPLPEGVIIEFELTPSQNGVVAAWIDFSGDPAPSFSNDMGEDVEGTASVLGGELIFADGFESGDTSAWSATTAP